MLSVSSYVEILHLLRLSKNKFNTYLPLVVVAAVAVSTFLARNIVSAQTQVVGGTQLEVHSAILSFTLLLF